MDLGLGRGVNATHFSPWLQKSTFQVQEVTPYNVVGTEEGGILQSYVDEVVSVEEIQLLMSSSIPASSKVTVGIDAELSRSYSTSRRSVGKKIITRSVSFKPDFEALLQHKAIGDLTAVAPHQPESPTDEEETDNVVAAASTREWSPAVYNFEQRLSLWIIESLIDEEVEGFDTIKPTDNPTWVLANFIFKWPGDVNGVKDLLQRKCRQFVNHFDVTHYVSGIDLGASQYEVLSEEKYQEELGLKNKLEILQLVSIATESRRKSIRGKKSSRTTEIGRFDGNSVHRGTTDEAVVGVVFQPISALIKVKVLRTALQKAIQNYIEDQENSRGKLLLFASRATTYIPSSTTSRPF